jgi:hypothetical protein
MDIIEILGVIALIFGIMSFFCRKDLNFKLMQLVANFIFFIHFYLLDSFAGAFSVGVGVIALSISLWKDNKITKFSFLGIYILFFIYSIFNFEAIKWFELLPSISNLFWIVSMIFLKDQKTNIALLPVVLLWSTYAIMVDSMSNLLTQIFILFVLLYRIYKFEKLNKLTKTKNML